MVGAIHTKVVDEAKYLQLSLHQWSDVNCDLKVVNYWDKNVNCMPMGGILLSEGGTL